MVLTSTTVGGASIALIRGHAGLATVNETATVSAAHASLPRIDLAVLRLDYAANNITFAIRAGTAASSPSAPSPVWGVSNQYEIPLAQIAVAANATTISNGNVTDVRRFVGQTIGSWPDNTRRPSGSPALGYNVAAGKWEATIDGSTWTNLLTSATTLTDISGTLPVSKGGTGATTAQAGRQNLDVYVQSTAPAHAVGRVWIKTP
jgi:hypothetical protein